MENLIITVNNRIASVELNRPEKRNALNPALIAGLTDTFLQLENDDDVSIILLKAAGNVFSAGADLDHLRQLQQNTFEENLEDSERLKTLFYTIYSSNKPVIAQVAGHAIAGGCGLLTVCDLVFAVPEAKFGYTEVKIGFLPALVACFLSQRIGEGRARHLLLTGELIDAATAMQYGLVNFVVPAEELQATVTDYAQRLAGGTSAASIAATKKLLRSLPSGTLEENLQRAVIANAESRLTDDFRNGVTGFLEKIKR